MDALVTYYRTGGSYHTPVDIALFHYQFETIHPYGGRKRTDRSSSYHFQLYDTDLLERPNLYLSEYFNRNKATYVDRMEAVRSHGEWEEWISFFVRGESGESPSKQRESVDRTLALDELRRRYENEYGGIQYAKHRLACNLSNSST